MTGVTTAGTAIALIAAVAAQAQPLVISRAGSRPLRSAPAENFTGRVRPSEPPSSLRT